MQEVVLDGHSVKLFDGQSVKRFFRNVKMPYSEVMMHMRIAGKMLSVAVVGDDENKHWTAQLIDGFGKPFSCPVLLAEAGIGYEYKRFTGEYVDAWIMKGYQ